MQSATFGALENTHRLLKDLVGWSGPDNKDDFCSVTMDCSFLMSLDISPLSFYRESTNTGIREFMESKVTSEVTFGVMAPATEVAGVLSTGESVIESGEAGLV